MSTTIDSRVVEMSFDNRNFESNVQTSLGTLDKLKQGLKFDESVKNLDSIDASVKKIDMNSLGTAVETVKMRFSAMEIVALTALTNITNSVINTGKQMLKSLTIDPIKEGFGEYELKMGSVQTIMASTGEPLDKVMEKLNELNTYADKTIYSFSDMTANIGKFTNAGVSLEDATKAIQGVSNVAAVSGANANEASRAMYNFAQALSSGNVKLIDWKSIENANMATVEFKNQLLDTAVACGKLEKTSDGMYRVLTENNNGKKMDGVIDATHNFNDSLSYQWMTTDVLTKTLAKYSDETTEIGKKAFAAAQDVKTFSQLMDTLKEAVGSGWAETWEIVFGNFDEAKALWTDVSNAVGGFIDAQSKARNALLQEWKDLGGRTDLIDSFKNAISGIASVIRPVKEAFRDIFPAVTGKTLADITAKLKEFTSKLIISENTANKIRNTFKGLFAVLDIGKQAITAIISGITRLGSALINTILPVGDGVLGVTSKFGDFLTKIDSTIKSADIFKKAVNKLVDFLLGIPSKINKVFKEITGISLGDAFDIFKKYVSDLLNKLKDDYEIFKQIVSEIIKYIQDIPSKVNAAFKKITGISLGDVFDSVKQKAKDLVDKLKEVIGEFKNIDTSGIDDFRERLKNSLNPIGALFEGFKKLISGIWELFKKLAPVFSTLATAIGKAFSSLGKAVSNAVQNADFDGLFDIVNGGVLVAIGTGIKKFLDSISSITENAGGMLKSISSILDGVRGCLETWQQNIKAKTLLTIASAIAILTASLVVLSMIDSSKLSSSLAVITGEFVELMTALKVLTKTIDGTDTGKMTKAAGVMVLMSGAILILTSAMKKISDLDWGEIVKGLTGIAALSTTLVLVAKQLSKCSGDMIKGSAGLLIFAEAIRMLVKPVKKLGEMSLENLAKGLLGVGVICTELALFLKYAKLDEVSLGKGLGLMTLAEALKILASAVAKFASIDVASMLKGLAGVAIVLAELVGFMKLTGDSKKVISTATGMVILGSAMLIFGKAIENMGKLSLAEIGKGLLTMASSLAIIAVALKFMPTNTPIIATGMILVGTALKIIASAMNSFGNMSWEGVAKGLITLAASLTIIAVAVKAMTGTLSGAAAMLVMANAIAILTPALKLLGNMSLAEIGSALLILAGAFTVIGVAGLVLGPITPIILALAAAVALLGVGALACGAGTLALSAGLSALAVTGTAAIGTLVLAIEAILSLIPQIVIKIGEGIVGLIVAIGNAAPEIINAVVQVALAILTAINQVVPQLIETVINIIDTLLLSLAEHAPSIIQSVIDIAIALIAAVRDNIGGIVDVVVDAIIALIEGIVVKLPDIIQAGIDIVIALIDGLGQGLVDNAPRIREAFIDLFKNLLLAVLGFLGIHSPSTVFADIGVNIIKGLIKGLGNMLSSLLSTMGSILKSLVSAIGNKLGEFLQKGKDLMVNIKNGIGNKISEVKSKISEGISGCVSTIKGKLSEFKTKGQELMSNLKTGISNKLSTIKDAAKNVVSGALSSIKDKMADWKSIGSNLMSGLKEGISSVASDVASAAKSVASKAINGVKNFLGIHSPSRVMMEIGKYTDEGFIIGLKSYASKVGDESEKIGKEAVNGMTNAISGVTSSIENNIDNEPTIRPVLDLTNITNGINSMDNMLASRRSIDLAASTNYDLNRRSNEPTVKDSIDNLKNAVKDLKTNQNGDIINNFNITSDAPKEVANEVSRIIQRQVERRGEVWA